MPEGFTFDRTETAASSAAPGTFLPIVAAMVLFNGLRPAGLFIDDLGRLHYVRQLLRQIRETVR